VDTVANPTEVILGTAPEATDFLAANYKGSITNTALISETPVASSTPGLYFLAFEPDGAVAVWADGLRLVGSQVAVTGQDVTISLGGVIPGHVEVSYVPKIDDVGDSYILQYSKDPGVTSLVNDTDIPAVPTRYHTALVEYAVGHCLLIGGDEDDIGDSDTTGPVIKALSSYAASVRSLGGEIRGAAAFGANKGAVN